MATYPTLGTTILCSFPAQILLSTCIMMEEKLSKSLLLSLLVFVTFDTVEAYVAITVACSHSPLLSAAVLGPFHLRLSE